MRLIGVDEQREMIQDDDVRVAFLSRPDIIGLPCDEQERRWQGHKLHLDRFRDALSKLPAINL